MANNFYIDTEFIEGFLPNRFLGVPMPKFLNKRRHAIDLISISIICENGEKYFAISNEYHFTDASQWVRENVIMPLFKKMIHGDSRNFYEEHNFHKYYGKSNKRIAKEIKEFILNQNPDSIKLYGYYSAYDHVLIASLFGTMMDLPKGFPMYTIDLEQMLEQRADKIFRWLTNVDKEMNKRPFEKKLEYIKTHHLFPKNLDEHDVESDVKFNKDLHEFLMKYE